MKAGGKYSSYKMSVNFQQTTQRYIPEDRKTLHYSLIIRPFDRMNAELLTASLNTSSLNNG
jgi:hypothetical protein